MPHSCIIQSASLIPRSEPPMSNRKLPANFRSAVAKSAAEPDLSRAQKLVLEMMAIPAKSGDEAVVAKYIREALLEAGAPADAITTDNANKQALIKGDTGNLILKLPGTVKGPRRMLSA